MEHKNPMSRVERLHREKVTRYSIRKYSFGAASVAVAALFMFLGNGAVSVQADEIQGNRVTESPKPQPEEDKSKPATEVAPVLNKTQLESYISEIETKLSNGSYDNKTEESVAVLKADLEAAKTTLANATTQAELKQAYSKLVTTVNSKLKNKPVEKKETPTVDTTEGKETVGKKAENTEPKSESNSIENTGSNDPRNEKAIPTGIQFRAEIAYSTNEETNENGKKNDYITSGVGGSTDSGTAQTVAPRILNYRTRFNKDENGKITSVDWMVYYNNHAENLSNTYGMRGELYRNYIQIPKEVNMPENIERLQYAVPNKPVFQGGKPVWPRPNGNSLYNEVTFDDPAPKSAVGIPLKTNVSFTKDKWPSTRSGRGYDTLAGKESDYFKDAAKTSGAKELVYADALTEEHVIWDQSNTGGDAQDAYVWKFTTTVPKTTTNEQLKNMKAVMGMFRVGTAGVDHGVHTIATNPVNVTDADVANPQPKPQPKPETSQLGVNNTYTQTNDTITVPTIASTDTVLTGTGTPGARINIKDGGKVVNNTTIVGENGQWTFPITTGLNSNVTGGKQLVDKSQISVSQTVNGVESADVPVNVSLGYSEIEPSSNSKEKNNLVENDRNVTLKVPHDAGAAYFKFTDPDGNVQTVELTRDSVPKRAGVPGNWQVTNSELASVTSSDQGDHYSTINLTLKKDMKAETTAEVVSNMQKGSYTSLQGWQSRDVEAAPKPQPETPVVAPTVEIPYSDPAPDKKEVYLYTGEEADVDITFNDDSGKIKSAALKQGGNRPLSAVDGNPDKQDNQFGYTVTAINSETPTPAKIKVTGQVSGIAAEKLPKTEDDSLDLVTRFATATDTDGAEISNNATKYVPGTKIITESYKTDPGAVTFVLKAQTKKYDIKTPSEADKVTVSNANNVTDKEFEKIKEKVKVEYSQENPDARLADKKGREVEDASKVVDKVEKVGNDVVVTYKDGSKDTKPLSEFVNVAPTVEVPYSNQAKKEIYVYTGENTDLTFKASDNTAVKDMYVRGPGGIGTDNTAGYGFTTGKIENSAVTHGDGTVSGPTATIKMTGVTTLKAPNHWTSFVVANDNDNAPSTTDFRALDQNPNATQTPGYVHFIVKSQTDKYDIATPAPADKVEVADPTNVTDAELDKIKEKLKLEYNKDNDDANIAKNTPVDKDGKIKSVTNDGKGNLVVTYTDGSKDTKPLSQFVTKKPTDADKNEPTPKAQTVDKDATPNAKDSIDNLKDLPKGTTVEFKTPVDTTTPGDKPATAVVTYPDGSKEEVPVKVTVKDPSAPATDADKNEPTPKAQTVDKGTEPKAEDSIGNLKDLPKGTTVAFKDPVDATTPGEKPATVVVTYPDGSKEEVPVKVTVKDPSAPATDADKNTPVAKDQTVKPGDKPKAEDSIDNLKDLPKGTTVEFKTPVDTTTPGDKPATAVVTYPDGSKEEVPVKVTVKDPSAPATDADKNTPVAKDQTVKPGDKPKAEDSIDNLKDLPKGTTVEFKTPVDTTTPGDKPATAVVTYPDGSKDEVPVKVTVKDPSAPATDADKNTPVAKDQTVKPGDKPKAEDSIDNLKDLPKGTTVEFKTPVDTTTPGDKPATAVVTYPDGSKEEVPVKVTVKDPSAPATDADKNTPVAKDQTVKPGDKPKAEDSIDNLKDLPKGTTVEFKTPVDTTTPGDKPATAVVTYPDGSKEEVPVKVTVKDPSAPATDADKNTPVAKDQTVKPGDKPKAEDSIDNLKDLPKGTTVEFKTPVDTTTPGDKPATAVVTYPDGSKEEVPVKVTVKDPSAPATDADKNTPVAKDQTVKPGDKPKAEDSIDNLKDLPKGTTVAFKDPVDATTPGEKPATVVVTYPDGSKEEVPVKVTVKDPSAPATDADKNTPVAKDQTVKPGDKPKAEDSIDNLKDLPKGTTVEFKTPVDTTTPGDKPATAVVTYPDGSKEEVPVKVTVKDPSAPATDADKNTPVAKDQTVKPGDKPKAEDSIDNLKDLPKGTTVEFKTPVDTTTPGDKPATAVVTYPDGSKDEVPVKVTVKDPSAPATDADKNTPVAKDQTVKPGDKPKAEDSIDNLKDLPKGTTVEFKTPVDTTTPGDKPATAVVTYPDGSKDEVPVKVTVKDPSAPATDADKNTPVAKDQTVKPGDKPKAEDSIDNLKDLPKGTTVEFKTPVDTTTPGDKPATAVVTYPDGSKEEVPVKVTVKDPSAPATDADKNTPVAKDQTVKPGDKPKAEDSIDNLKDLPKGTTVEFKTPVDTTTPGDKPATAVVTYPDGSKEEVPVKVTVKDPSAPATDADKNTPVAKDQTVKPGDKPKAEDSIDNLKDLPKGTTVEFKTPVDTTTPGDKPATAVVTYPDGSKEEVPVKVTVKDPSAPATDADKNTPVAKDQTVKPGDKPKAEDSIDNLKDLPKGTTVEFKTPVDTTTPGDKPATAVVTYPDGSKEEVPVKVTVKDPSAPATDADKNTPVAKDQTVKPGDKPKAEDSIDNLKDLPKGTTVEFKTPVDTTTPGDKPATAVVTYPDGSKEEVPVKVTVKDPSAPATDADKNTPVAKDQTVKPGDKPKAEDSIDNLKDLPKGTTVAFKDPVDATTPGEKPATVVVTYPDGSKEEVPVKVTVKDPSAPATDADKNTPVAKDQTVKPGDKPKAEDSIDNLKDLPKGTTVEFKTPVDTTTPGDKPATAVVTYPDGSKEEVPVKVTVNDPSAPATDADKNTPVAKDQTVKPGDKPKAEDSIDNLKDLPKGTTVEFKTPVDTTTPGDKPATAVVTYPDGSKEEVPVKVTVNDPSAPATDADKNTPVAKDQTVKPGDKPKAEDSIDNLKDLPKGTTVAFKDPVDATTPGEKPATAVVTYPDGSKEEVPVKVTVKDPSAPATDADKNTPVAKDQTVKPGDKPKAEDSIDNLKDLPKGTTVAFKDPVDATTPGEKPATVVVTYPDGSKEEVPVKVTVKDPSAPATDADKNTPVAKDQTVKPGDKPKAEDSIDNLKDLPKGTTVEFKTPVDTTTPGDKPATAVVTYPDGSKEEVPVKVTVKDPSAPATDADKNTPVAKDQTVKPGDKPKAEDSIDNLKDLPKGTTVEFKTPVDTTTPGDKPATAVVTYPDGSKEEVPVKVTVKDPSAPATDADKNTPVAKDQTVKPGDKPKAEDSIDNLKDLPKGTTVEFKTPVDTTTPGDKPATAVVTYPDGSKEEVPVKVTVKDPSAPATDADKNTPVAKDQTVKPGDKPKAEDSIDNLKDLPKGTTVEFKTPVDTTTPGDKPATAVVTYPDGSKEEVPVKVTVKDPSAPATDADKNTPVAKDQTVKPGDKPKAEDSIDNLKDLPKGTTVEFKTPVDTTTPGDKPATAVVTYPDGSKEEVPVKVTVKDPSAPATDADKNTPVAKDQTVKPGDKPKAEDSIDNLKDLPKGTTVEFKTPVDTTTPGDKPATAVVTYPDGSKEEVPVKVTVKDPSAPATDADKNTPVAKDQTVKPGDKPSAKDSIGNVGDLPEGTTAEFKTPVDTTTPGEKDATVVVTYPDGSKDEVPVKVTVKDPSAPATDADKNKVTDPAVTPVTDPSNLTDAEKAKVADEVKKSNPSVTDVKVGKDGTTTVTYPDGSTAVIPSGDTVKKSSDNAVKDPSVTPVTDPSNLTDAEKAKVAEEVKKSNPTVTDVKVGKDGTTTVTFPDGSTAVIPSGDTVKKSSDNAVKDPSVTPVTDPSNLTDAEKAKVAEEVKKSNPTVTDVKVGKDGTTTVTFPDGSTAVIPSGDTVKKSSDNAVKDPAVTPVKDPSNLTDAEKAKVAEEVKKSNPTVTDVKVGKDGTTTVIFPDGSTAVIPSGDTVKKSSDNAVKDPAVTPVKDPSNLTDAEKAKVAEEVKKSNPTVTDVKVGKDGTTTVTFPDGSTAVIPSGDTVKKSSDNAVKDPSVTPVKDPSNLTDAEKAKVAEEVKKSNPTVINVKVGKDGTTTVTFPDGSTAVIPSGDTVKKSSDNAVKDPAVTPVKDPSNLTDAEKGKVAEEVKKSNPTAKDVEVGKDGTATVTFPDGSTAVIPSGDTVKKSSDNAVKDPAVTPVKDPSNLTDAEKAKVAEEVKKSNPTVTDVKVGKDGTTTVTFPDGSTAVIPSGDTVKKSSDNAVKDPSVTPVKDPSNLTDAEKAKVAEEVKKSNPTVINVKVGKDGTTTVTFPDGSTAVIPSGDTVKKSSDNAVKDPAVTPVKDPSNLTDAEKGKVAEEVKKSNPTAKDVEVGKDGTATVTFPDGSTAVIPSGDTVKKSSDNAVKDPAVTPVVDPSNLTDAEKAKVADEVKKANPTAKDVEVGKDGTATVTFPDGSTAVIPSGDTVKKSSDNAVKDPAVTPVVDPSNLTDAEKAKVAEEVKKSNPTAKDVEVGKDGTATVTFPDGSTAVIPSGDTVKKSSDNAVKDPAVTPVVDPSNLTDAEKAKVADEVKKSNPTAKDIKVNKDGSVVVTFEDGTTAFIPADKTVKSADSNGVQDPSTPATDASKNKVTDPAVTPVKDPANLTDAEKAKVAEEVKKSNPTAKDIKVNKDGSVVVTFEDGTTAVIPADKTVKSADSNGVQDPSATPANDQAAQKPAVAPATTPAAANASQTASAQANARQAAKELPNTGTANSTVAMVAAAASALLGLGLAGRRRKEDEEA